jgi:hypothetical protein
MQGPPAGESRRIERAQTTAVRALTAGGVALVALLSLAACDARRNGDVATWRTDCPSPVRPAPLSLEAARDAHRRSEQRHAMKLREAASPGSFLREIHAALDPERVAAGDVCLTELADRGQLLFEHEFAFADGLGGGRSTIPPGDPFRRVHGGEFGGPETISCPSCHWVGGPNGAGAETDNAFLVGDGDRPESGDARNPPALLALGVVEALAREMTRDLAAQREELLREAALNGATRKTRLVAKGVDFGVLRALPEGTIDATGVRGIDSDLVVKPFGWKGTLAKIADFSTEALQLHFGVQYEDLVAGGPSALAGEGEDALDPDADGMRRELGRGPFTAMLVHLALLEMPMVEPLVQDRVLEAAAPALLPPTTTSFASDFQRGRAQFHALGCAGCHLPRMVLNDPVLELDGAPPIDLARTMQRPALAYDPELGGYPVWLFSDLKRHDMGEASAARHVQRGVPPREYLTPRLWGVADSAPYLHDGRAPSLDYAIAGHGGEGAAARAAFAELPFEERGALRVYLMSMRRASRVIVP